MDISTSNTPNDHPLSGLRVIDFTHVLAGPACSYFLGLLGADVIKVESLKGDAMRHRGGMDAGLTDVGMSTAYLTQGAGKRSIAIDLSSSEGKYIIEQLLKSADIFVENHLPSTMAALGLDEKSLQIRHPRLIHCAMTGYGRGGDRENAPAYDVNIQAACGIMTLTGTADTGPLRTGAPIMDYGAALAAGFAITAALNQRNRTNKGTFIDVSMLETGFTLMSSTITDFLATDRAPQQRGNAANSRSPGAGSYECKEGILSLGINEESQYIALANVLGKNEWLSDPRFRIRQNRATNAKALEKELAETLMVRTAREWEKIMLQNGVPAACLRSLPESLAQHQTKSRNYIHEDPRTGLKTPTLPFRIGNIKSHIPRSSAPQIGEHSKEILEDLGFSLEEISVLITDGVVKTNDEAARTQ